MNYALPDAAREWIAAALKGMPTGIVIELGSGEGTPLLRKAVAPHTVFSVEHDKRFLEYADVIVPLSKGWYSKSAFVECVPNPSKVRALIVDGPPGVIGREGITGAMHFFPAKVPMLIDDVHRPAEMAIALELGRIRKQPVVVHSAPKRRAFATIGWDRL